MKAHKRPVIACTEWRGVFFGYLDSQEDSSRTLRLADARMAIYWGTTRGVIELAETGPTKQSKISAKADILLHNITALFEVSEVAEAVWKNLP